MEQNPLLEVAVPTPVFGTFTYSNESVVPPGTRVLVPFGGRKLVGVVTAISSKDSKASKFAIKSVTEVIDQTPIFSPALLKLAVWMSSYYIHPIGDVFKTMLPASLQKKKKNGFYLTAVGLEKIANEAESYECVLLKKIYEARDVYPERNLAAALTRHQKKIPVEERVSIESLVSLGLVRNGMRSSQKARPKLSDDAVTEIDLDAIARKSLQLRGKQAEVFEAILKLGIDAPHAERRPLLLRGVTGSGKTEIYLQSIAAVLKNEKALNGVLPQSLVLVPEISLTPQMTRIFAERFPGRVAVVHSAMTDEERWKELDRVRSGSALVLIGPRSAVFGSFVNLKLLIVDEEHDGSYKQQSGLHYHGRDIAVLRAKLESATVLLGSATPSLESYHNALEGKYHLLELPERVSGMPLPKVNIIEAKPPQNFGQILSKANLAPGGIVASSIPIDESIIAELAANLKAQQQSIVLVNRRGFAYYLFSLKHKKALPCPNCSISLTLHKRSINLHCHYCDYRISTAKVVEDHPDDTFVAVGYGSEKLEHMLSERLSNARIVRLDSDTVAKREVLPETLQKFRNGEVDVLVGTQILAKGHDFPNVTLMVILDVDQLLDLPDFRSAERTFQLIVQAAGRAGRAELPGRVLIQCSRTNDPTIQLALNQDYKTFAERELELRKACRYPPFLRMVHIELSSGDVKELDDFVTRVVRWLDSMAELEPELPKQVKILGPSIPAIEIIRNRFRRSLILCSSRMDALLHLAKGFQSAFAKVGGDIRFKIDVDPQSLI